MGNISIKWQLIIICVLLVTVPVVVLGVLSFNTSRQTILDNVEDTLKVQCIDWSIVIKSYYDLIEENKRAAKATTEDIIASQSSGVLRLIQNHFKGDLAVVVLKDPLIRVRKNEENMLFNVFSVDEFDIYAKQFDTAIKDIENIIDEAASKNIDTQRVKLALSGYLKEVSKVRLKGVQSAIEEVSKNISDRRLVFNEAFSDLADRLFDERLKETLSSTVIGKTGYVYIIDYKGNYILSKGRKTDGENIWYVEDSEGEFVIQDVVMKGRALSQNEVDYHTYSWKDAGESNYREKRVAIMHIPQKEWIVGTVIYTDELIESDFEEVKKQELKDLMAKQTFSKTGNLSLIKVDEEADSFIKDIVTDAMNLGGGESRVKHYLGSGTERQEVLAYSYFKPWNWIIIASIYLDEFFEDINAVKNKIIFICVIAILLGSSIVYFFSTLMTRTLSQLVGKMNSVARGDLDVDMEDVSVLGDKNEMGQLAGAFKKMTDNLRDTTFSKDYVDSIIGNMNDALFVIDPDARVTMINEATCRLIGSTESDILKYPAGNFLISGKEDFKIFKEKLFKAGVVENLEMGLKNKKGKIIPINISGASLKNLDGSITGAILVVRDVSEHKKLLKELSGARKNLEEKVERLEKSDKAMLFMVEDLNKTTEELKLARNNLQDKIDEVEKINKELDDFTYIVSHDLKEPLRGVKAFTKLLVEDYSEKLDKGAKDYISTISDSSSRMSRLIEDLLNLSRIGRIGSIEPDVDLNGLLSDVQKDLMYSLEEKKVDLKLAKDFPKVTCDRVRIREVFANLISNAIKYSKKDEKPVIEVGHSEKNGFYEFFIKDNGVGIEKEYYDRVFQIFQRLHAKGEYEGTGAGLTIVKKIVENHGGSIWVTSEVNKGSTFYFTIKKE